jgi:transposase-like protein
MIYTTNAIESLNAKLRRSVRSRGHFPSDDAALKLIWLDLAAIARDHSKVEDVLARVGSCQSSVRSGVRRSLRGQSLINRGSTHRIADSPLKGMSISLTTL